VVDCVALVPALFVQVSV
jgi:hypothetical protein